MESLQVSLFFPIFAVEKWIKSPVVLVDNP